MDPGHIPKLERQSLRLLIKKKNKSVLKKMASVFSSKEKGEGKEVAPGLGGLNPRGFAAGFQGGKTLE